jgi:hypothetical protein
VAWHMTTLDTDVTKRGVRSLGLTDENVALLRRVDCDILGQVDCVYPGTKLNRINRLLISTRCILFFWKPALKTSCLV